MRFRLNAIQLSSYSVFMLSTGLAVATLHACTITVRITTADTMTKARGNSYQ